MLNLSNHLIFLRLQLYFQGKVFFNSVFWNSEKQKFKAVHKKQGVYNLIKFLVICYLIIAWAKYLHYLQNVKNALFSNFATLLIFHAQTNALALTLEGFTKSQQIAEFFLIAIKKRNLNNQKRKVIKMVN
jgi:hypothetical protein